jgi:hypothetical protein
MADAALALPFRSATDREHANIGRGSCIWSSG